MSLRAAASPPCERQLWAVTLTVRNRPAKIAFNDS
jgi:hypothetical protein